MLRLIGDFDLCTGCKSCELVCSLEKWGGFNANRALLYVDEDLDGFLTRPVPCAQCLNPFCQKACPVEAIYREEKSGALIINKDICIRCGLCQEYCPLGVIQRVGDIVDKCDVCNGKPLCVEACPSGALKIIDIPDTKEV